MHQSSRSVSLWLCRNSFFSTSSTCGHFKVYRVHPPWFLRPNSICTIPARTPCATSLSLISANRRVLDSSTSPFPRQRISAAAAARGQSILSYVEVMKISLPYQPLSKILNQKNTTYKIDTIRKLAPQMNLTPNNQVLAVVWNVFQRIVGEYLTPILVWRAPIMKRALYGTALVCRVRIDKGAIKIPFLARSEEGAVPSANYVCKRGWWPPRLYNYIFG